MRSDQEYARLAILPEHDDDAEITAEVLHTDVIEWLGAGEAVAERRTSARIQLPGELDHFPPLTGGQLVKLL
ncbi:hypothetical protein QEZ54_33180 [Catellatospora sp. KI3]|uniref:hypothetical protein n=1 Tax=Catellatospora sp. KI3 TaxID=3041620 RepID=UPI002482948F|nr:hypothetical protein [Catellatospora sp. KI3]MDI1465837.1 hypothetical protein [Catellatospora sp. KI3]